MLGKALNGLQQDILRVRTAPIGLFPTGGYFYFALLSRRTNPEMPWIAEKCNNNVMAVPEM